MEARAALKHQIILSCLDQYMQTVKQSRPWSGLGITPKIIKILTKLFCTSGPNLVIGWWVIMWTNLKPRIGWNLTLKWNLTFQVKVNHSRNNRDLDQGALHLWSKFGNPNLNGSQVTTQTNLWSTDTQTDGHTDEGDDNTLRPKLALHKHYLQRREYS